MYDYLPEVEMQPANVVLVPGIFGFERFGPIQYFNGVAAYLEKAFPDLHVRAAATDPLGTVADRAGFLAGEISRLFGSSEEIHLVTHSMGGLDARFLVSRNLAAMSARVKTIVTIGTPHAGSPVATALEAVNPIDSLTALLGLENPFLDELRGKINALKDLSERGATTFNQQYADLPHIRYLEIAGTGRDRQPPTSLFFAPMYFFVHAKAGANDGVVPVSSAQRGRPLFATWAGDHADLVGHDLNGPTPMSVPQFNHLAAYGDIIRRGICGQTAQDATHDER
jgi:triacylglycerol lipase